MRLFNTVKFSSSSNAHSGGLGKSLIVMAVTGRRGVGNFTRIYNFDKYNPQPKIKKTMEHLIELFYSVTFPN
jgi:hypothetical protein